MRVTVWREHARFNLTPDILTVDAGEAGEGNLEILVSSPSGVNVPTQVEALGGARFGVSFGPRQPGHHTVQVTFNDEPVPGKLQNVDVTGQNREGERARPGTAPIWEGRET